MAQKSFVLFAFPLILVIVSILMQSNTAQGASTLNGNGQVAICTPGQNCNAGSGATSYNCASPLGVPCKIAPNCINPTPAPAWCFPWPFSLIPSNAGTWLNAGDSVVLTTNQQAQGEQAGSAVFGFQLSGVNGWVATALIVGIGVAVLAGFTIVGSGLNAESIHILFMGGMLVGIWLILAGIDGFIFGNQASMFAILNNVLPNFGSFVFGIGSLMWCLGTVGAVSRGGVG